MHFATFYQPSAIDRKELVEACGDRAVIVLDGRNNRPDHHRIAIATCKGRGYSAYQLHAGKSFTRVSYSTPIYPVIISKEIS